ERSAHNARRTKSRKVSTQRTQLSQSNWQPATLGELSAWKVSLGTPSRSHLEPQCRQKIVQDYCRNVHKPFDFPLLPSQVRLRRRILTQRPETFSGWQNVPRRF